MTEATQEQHTAVWASLVAQLVKTPPAKQETLVHFLGWENTLEKGQATPSGFLDFLGSSDGKESTRNVGVQGSVPGLGRSPGGGHGNPLQYSCLENLMDRRAWWAPVHEIAKSWTH